MSTRPRTPAPGTPAPGKLPITELAALVERRQPIVMITAYDAPSGRLADEAGADLILVGDSAAMTVLGHDSTVPANTASVPGGSWRSRNGWLNQTTLSVAVSSAILASVMESLALGRRVPIDFTSATTVTSLPRGSLSSAGRSLRST